MNDESQPEGRLSRWSKRKRAVAREPNPEGESAEAIDVEAAARHEAERLALLQANREAAEAVDLETLTKETDFSVFMKEGVPDLLKKQAMAVLWRSNPVFANVDGLVDYGADYGSADLNMKTFKSAYQAGRGYLDLFKEKEAVAEVAPLPFESEEMAEAPVEAEDDAVTELADAEDTEALVGEFETSESEAIQEGMDEEPSPRVSLRKRLELDQMDVS